MIPGTGQQSLSLERILSFSAHNCECCLDCQCSPLIFDMFSFYRDLFLSAIHPQRKNIVIVIDHGTSLSDTQLITAKEVAKHILISLGPDDKVGNNAFKTWFDDVNIFLFGYKFLGGTLNCDWEVCLRGCKDSQKLFSTPRYLVLFQVSVISLADEVGYLRHDSCLSYRLTKLTFEAKLLYGNFIDKLEKQKSEYKMVLGSLTML